MCKTILEEFQQEYLIFQQIQKSGEALRRKLEIDGMSPHAGGALDGKHLYFNYKRFFTLVQLALVDAEHKFLWVNVGSSGSSSDAQIYTPSKMRKKIENGTYGLPPPEPLGPGGPNLHYFLLV